MVFVAKVFYRSSGPSQVCSTNGTNQDVGNEAEGRILISNTSTEGEGESKLGDGTFQWLIRKMCKEAKYEAAHSPKTTVKVKFILVQNSKFIFK